MRRLPKKVKRVPRHAGDLASLPSLRKPTFDGINDDLRNLIATSRSRSWDLRHQIIIVEVQMVWNKKVFALRCKLFLHLEQSHRHALQLLPSILPSQPRQVDSFVVHSKGKTKTERMRTMTRLELT